jgi:peptide/nickel transport system substrate-binding protein
MILLIGCTESLDLDDKILHYNQSNNITSLDPVFAKSMNNIWAVDHIYNGLVQFDDDMNIVPDVAHSWDVDSSGTMYTFHLNTSIRFHDDPIFPKYRYLKASDVVYSFNRLIDDKVNSPGSWVMKGRVADDMPFVSLDDSTFVLRLRKPFPPMLGILTMQYCSIVAQEAVEGYGDDFRKKGLGTGPFMVKNWKENQGLFLTSWSGFKDWNDRRSELDGLRISFMADRKTALMELLSGKLNLISGMDATYKAILLDENGRIQARHRDKIDLKKAPFLNTEYLGINLERAQRTNSPLANREFRQALNLALDKSLLVSSLRSNFGTPANHGFIPDGINFSDGELEGYDYNLKRARESLEACNCDYSSSSIVLYTNSDYLDICLFAANQWSKIGVKVDVELLESSLLRDRMRKGELTFFRASWIGDYPDPETFLTVFYGSNPAPPNYTRFNNTDFDSLYQEAMRISDVDHRNEIYRSMDSLIIAEAPVILLFYDETMVLTSKDVKGVSRNAFNLLRMVSLSLLQN